MAFLLSKVNNHIYGWWINVWFPYIFRDGNSWPPESFNFANPELSTAQRLQCCAISVQVVPKIVDKIISIFSIHIFNTFKPSYFSLVMFAHSFPVWLPCDSAQSPINIVSNTVTSIGENICHQYMNRLLLLHLLYSLILTFLDKTSITFSFLHKTGLFITHKSLSISIFFGFLIYFFCIFIKT